MGLKFQDKGYRLSLARNGELLNDFELRHDMIRILPPW